MTTLKNKKNLKGCELAWQMIPFIIVDEEMTITDIVISKLSSFYLA